MTTDPSRFLQGTKNLDTHSDRFQGRKIPEDTLSPVRVSPSRKSGAKSTIPTEDEDPRVSPRLEAVQPFPTPMEVYNRHQTQLQSLRIRSPVPTAPIGGSSEVHSTSPAPNTATDNPSPAVTVPIQNPSPA